MNPQQLLALLLGGNTQMFGMNQQNNQNPLLQLLTGNQQQDPTQQLIAMLSGVTGQQQNAINPQILQLLAAVGGQQQQQNGINPQMLQLLAGMAGGQQQQQTSGLDMAKLQELLQKGSGQKKEKTIEDQIAEMLTGKKPEGDGDDDVLARMLNNFNKQNEAKDTEADLTEAIAFGYEFDKFIEENEEMLPDWFNIKEVKEDVDKWAKTPTERSQGLAAATVRAFFKDEKMLDLLEERDRTAVKDKILKEGIKSHEIDRKLAWPLVERALFNKNKLGESGSEVTGSKESKAMEDYGSIFEQGKLPNNAAAGSQAA
ncbi:MAG: hypothetical protein ACK5MF_06385 [Vibrio sp.]|uniref:hypothetical protein n=1 Tax=Vibrio sp. TaxID=678 RepID=UPI003A891BE4